MMERCVGSTSLMACLVAALLVMSTLSSCTIRRITINEPITQEDVVFVKPGETTLDEVVARLGAPDELTGTQSLAIFRYHFGSTKTFRINLGWIARFWSPVSPMLTFGRLAAGTDALQITFDREWVVRSVAFSDNARTTDFNPWPF